MKLITELSPITQGLNNRGYAFVDYQTHKAAAKARRKLVPCKIKIRGHEIQVDWATPCHESGDSLSIQTSLLIKNLRQTCKNDELVYYYSLRNKFKIIKFKRLPTQALISFNSKQEAEFAMRIYNGQLLRSFVIRSDSFRSDLRRLF